MLIIFLEIKVPVDSKGIKQGIKAVANNLPDILDDKNIREIAIKNIDFKVKELSMSAAPFFTL